MSATFNIVLLKKCLVLKIKESIMETPVGTLLKIKGNTVVTTSTSTTIFDAVKQMEDNHIGSLPVVDNAGKIVGMLTERDCLRKVLLKERPLRSVTAGDVMSSPIITVQSSELIESCMKIMTDKRLRHLPVMEHNKLIGLISIGDVVKFLCTEREQDIKNLENYITGSL
jgi:CBS domain-containing protein